MGINLNRFICRVLSIYFFIALSLVYKTIISFNLIKLPIRTFAQSSREKLLKFSSSLPTKENQRTSFNRIFWSPKPALYSPTMSTELLNSNYSNHQNGLEFYKLLRDCKDNYISRHINNALNVLSDSLRLYGPNHVFSSYNGGKDADIIMHLLRAVCAKYEADHPGIKCNSTLIYFAIEDDFPEVLQHIDLVQENYRPNLIRYDCGIVQVRYLQHSSSTKLLS
jgi:hypothetical protein